MSAVVCYFLDQVLLLLGLTIQQRINKVADFMVNAFVFFHF